MRPISHKLVGLFEIACGLAGLVVLSVAFKTAREQADIAAGAFMAALSVACIVAGCLLIARVRLGLLLSIALQILQVAVLHTPEGTFGFQVGLILNVSFGVFNVGGVSGVLSISVVSLLALALLFLGARRRRDDRLANGEEAA